MAIAIIKIMITIIKIKICDYIKNINTVKIE